MKIKNVEKTKNNGIFLLAALFAGAMICFPGVTTNGAKSAIIIWINSIVPMLLPFFIFSDFVKNTEAIHNISPRIYPLVIAILSGYPMGAKTTADFVGQKVLGRDEGCRVLAYAMVTGPAFLTGTIGIFLDSQRASIVVLIAHYISALLNGIIWSQSWSCQTGGVCTTGRRSSAADAHEAARLHTAGGAMRTSELFSASILSGLRAMGIILAYLMLFMIGMNLLDQVGFRQLIENEMMASFIKGLLEMTAGASMVGACNAPMVLKIFCVAVLVSFGGLSVIGQSASMTAGSGISAMDIFKRKVTHGILAGLIAFPLANLAF